MIVPVDDTVFQSELDDSHQNVIDKQHESQKGTFRHRCYKNFSRHCNYIYILIDGRLPYSWQGKICNVALSSAIFLGFVAGFVSTVPEFTHSPATCPEPACNNDPQLCPGIMICEPVPLPVFELIETVLIAFFTIEYGIKLLTCWAVSAKDLEIVPSSSQEKPTSYPLYELYFRYIFAFKNLADLVTVLPFYVMLGSTRTSVGVTFFLRVFRLAKIVRLYKGIRRVKGAYVMLEMVIKTFTISIEPLCVMLGFIFMAMVLYGSIIFLVESGTYTVTEEYPHGAFMRLAANGIAHEVSPFNSIPSSMYYVVVTVTTVGYGDMCATSWVGRMIGCIVSLSGIVVLALPIGIIGSTFAELYNEHLFIKAHGEKIDLASMDDKSMIDLFRHIDENNSHTVDIFSIKEAFSKGGVVVSGPRLLKEFCAVDHSGTGLIALHEFIQLCKMVVQDDDSLGETAAASPDKGGALTVILSKIPNAPVPLQKSTSDTDRRSGTSGGVVVEGGGGFNRMSGLATAMGAGSSGTKSSPRDLDSNHKEDDDDIHEFKANHCRSSSSDGNDPPAAGVGVLPPACADELGNKHRQIYDEEKSGQRVAECTPSEELLRLFEQASQARTRHQQELDAIMAKIQLLSGVVKPVV